jgi:predicted nucleic acid-binding Zn ribbon protein
MTDDSFEHIHNPNMSPELRALMEEWNKTQKPNMPIYKFVCKPCKREEKHLLKKEEADKFSGACSMCGQPLTQVIGIPESQSKETVDEYRNKRVVSDIDKKLDERAKEHFNKHDLPRLIDEKGLEWCKKQGFVDQDGKPR